MEFRRVLFRSKNGELVFLHQMQAGPADRSYGVHVAKLAGLPESLLKNAAQILERLENEGQQLPASVSKPEEQPALSSEQKESTAENNDVSPDQQLSLFGDSEPAVDPVGEKVVSELKNANLMAMTPMEVMNAVYKWQGRLNKKK